LKILSQILHLASDKFKAKLATNRQRRALKREQRHAGICRVE
jgi:hypothetical protein